MTRPLPMTPGRAVALAIGAPLALAFFGWNAFTAVAWAGQGSYRVNLSIPAHGRTATIAVDSGDVRLEPGAPGQLTVAGTARYALFRSSTRWRQTTAGPNVTSRCHQITGPCSFDYTVSLPAGLGLHVSDGSGNVVASSLSGDVRLEADSGDITGSGLAGGRLVAGDQSGNISLTGLTSQNVTVTDDSGDITVILRAVPGTVRISDQSGNIRLVLPPGRTAYRVTASTASGRRTVHVPQNSASPHVITVTNESGDVSITR